MGKKFTITESERNLIRGLYEQQTKEKSIQISELSNKTVNFEFFCYKTSYGDIQVKIENATYEKIIGDDDITQNIILNVHLLEDPTTKFKIMVLNKEGTINWNFAMMGPYGKKIKFCDSGLKTLKNDNFFKYLQSLKKYPITRVNKQKTKTDF